MADSRNKVLSVQNLVINFRTDNGTVQAVRDVSFDLYEGETLCIVGESGSGKSVTSKAIMGILANNAIIDGGAIIYRGENLLEISEDEFYKIRGHRIGMIFQDPLSSLNPIVKIGKQITEAMLINSDKLKTMYNDLISDDLIRYKNTLARMNLTIANEKKKLDLFAAECRAKAMWVATLPDPTILIFVFFKEKVLLGGIVGPNIFDAFILVAFILDFHEVFDDFHRCAGALGVVDKFFFGCGPGRVFQFRC